MQKIRLFSKEKENTTENKRNKVNDNGTVAFQDKVPTTITKLSTHQHSLSSEILMQL